MTPPRQAKSSTDGSYSNAWRNFTRLLFPPAIRMMLRLEARGLENLSGKGGMLLAANHLSYMDILALSLFVHRAGRYPVFLAKSSLFKVPLLGPLMRRLGQLPVYRGQVDAALVLKDAERVGREGECVIFYPEATVTRDPDMWPMVAKTGVARLALTADIPVVPVAEWGAQWILPYGAKLPKIFPHKPVQVLAGPPVDLSEFKGQPLTNQVLRAATDKIMTDVTALVGELRGEVPPAKPYHPAVERRKLRQDLRALKEAADEAAAAGAAPADGVAPADGGTAPAGDAAKVADTAAPEADSQ